jgi:RNA polymerase sigma-70 factor (sigma-E family)
METALAMTADDSPLALSGAEPLEVVHAPLVHDDFNQLYQYEYVGMVRLARGLVDTTERAEEIVQDAFAKLLDRWNRVDEPGAYLRTAVVNGARSELRKREVRRRVGLQRRPDPDPLERDYLIDALDKLPPKRKTALVLRYYADMTEKEIASTMGVRPGTVKSMLSRGLAELRTVIER